MEWLALCHTLLDPLEMWTQLETYLPGQYQLSYQLLSCCIATTIRPTPSLVTTPTPASVGSYKHTAEEAISESAQILEGAFSQLYLEGDIVSCSVVRCIYSSPNFGNCTISRVCSLASTGLSLRTSEGRSSEVLV